jgi:hypothetical protein
MQPSETGLFEAAINYLILLSLSPVRYIASLPSGERSAALRAKQPGEGVAGWGDTFAPRPGARRAPTSPRVEV